METFLLVLKYSANNILEYVQLFGPVTAPPRNSTAILIVSLQPVDMHKHSWTNYVQAAYKGVFEYLHTHEASKMPKKIVGLNLVIEGQVPQGDAQSHFSHYLMTRAQTT